MAKRVEWLWPMCFLVITIRVENYPLLLYKNADQLPDFEDYSMKNRTCRYFKDTPLFAFGHGLSYSTFEIKKAGLKNKTLKVGKFTLLSLEMKNSSERCGEELVQVYVRYLQDPNGPIKTLKAYKRVNLNANEKQKVTINLPATTFEFFDENTNSMTIKPSIYVVLYGSTSADNELRKLK